MCFASWWTVAYALPVAAFLLVAAIYFWEETYGDRPPLRPGQPVPALATYERLGPVVTPVALVFAAALAVMAVYRLLQALGVITIAYVRVYPDGSALLGTPLESLRGRGVVVHRGSAVTLSVVDHPGFMRIWGWTDKTGHATSQLWRISVDGRRHAWGAPFKAREDARVRMEEVVRRLPPLRARTVESSMAARAVKRRGTWYDRASQRWGGSGQAE